MQKISRKMVIIALFIIVKTFKLFIVENFNIHESRVGEWTHVLTIIQLQQSIFCLLFL